MLKDIASPNIWVSRSTTFSTKNRKNNVRREFSYHALDGGFSYIEVLISLLIFSIGFLGFAQAQRANLSLAMESLDMQTAMHILSSSAELSNANTERVLEVWHEYAVTSLPAGNLSLENGEDGIQLKISWRDRSNLSTPALSKELTLPW